jgi:hypothetical protein
MTSDVLVMDISNKMQIFPYKTIVLSHYRSRCTRVGCIAGFNVELFIFLRSSSESTMCRGRIDDNDRIRLNI